MMNFYEKEMRTMFGKNDLLTDMKFVGKTLLGKLDEDKLLKLQLKSTEIDGHYDAILATVFNKNEGAIDKQTFHFSDIVGMYDCGDGSPISPYMWDYNGKSQWRTPINNTQKSEIASTVLDYAGMFQDRSNELSLQFQ